MAKNVCNAITSAGKIKLNVTFFDMTSQLFNFQTIFTKEFVHGFFIWLNGNARTVCSNIGNIFT